MPENSDLSSPPIRLSAECAARRARARARRQAQIPLGQKVLRWARLWLCTVPVVLGVPVTLSACGVGRVRTAELTHHLAPCSEDANCVTSLDASSRQFVPPLAFDARAEAPAAALSRLAAVVTAQGGRVKKLTPGYLHAEFDRPYSRLVDDLEVMPDTHQAGRLDVRSAARLGSYDFGANGKRMVRLRRDFTAST